jgi:hypothetical protein
VEFGGGDESRMERLLGLLKAAWPDLYHVDARMDLDTQIIARAVNLA